MTNNNTNNEIIMTEVELREMLEEAYMDGFMYRYNNGTLLGTRREANVAIDKIVELHRERNYTWFGKYVNKLRMDNELVDTLSNMNKRILNVLKINDLKDMGSVNNVEAEELGNYVKWYEDDNGNVHYTFSIRQLTREGEAIVKMVRTVKDTLGSINTTYTLVKIPTAEEYAEKSSLHDDLFGGIDMDEIFDKFFGQYGMKRRRDK